MSYCLPKFQWNENKFERNVKNTKKKKIWIASSVDASMEGKVTYTQSHKEAENIEEAKQKTFQN